MLVNWEKVAERRLARAGWLREVAGEADWGRVVAAFARGMEASPPRGALLSGAFGCGKTLAATALYRVEGVDGTPDANAYAGIRAITLEGGHYRGDIAHRALQRTP